MKNLKIYTLALCAFCFCATNTWSQKIYTAAAPTGLTNISTEQRPVERSIQQAFSRSAQTMVIDFSGTQISSPSASYRQSIQQTIRKGEFFAVTNLAAMQTIVQQKPEMLTLIMPFNGKKITVDLTISQSLSDNFKVVTNQNASPNIQLGAYYKGVVRGEKSVASFSFFSSHVEGLIFFSDKPAVQMGKLLNSGADNMHVIYSEDNRLKNPDFVCRTPEPSADYIKEMNSVQRLSVNATTSLKCVTEFWETSYNIYQKFGNTQNVTDFITALFNSFSTIYANENIGMKLNGTYIWTSADPYNNSLDTFSNRRRNFGANLAMLISTTGGGGVAWLNSICSSSDQYRHAFCGAITSSGSAVPTYSWPVEVTTHETGHNLGSPHTHACAWNGNNTAIDGCGPKAGYSEGCDGPIPAKGTIMSYCHLVSGVGIDFTLGFGPQPGDLIRGRVNSCITLTCGGTSSCDSPSNVRASKITSSTATVSWGAVTGAKTYNLQYQVLGSSTWTKANGLKTTSYTIKSLASNTTYRYQVRTVCSDTSGDGSIYTKPSSFKTLAATGITSSFALSKTLSSSPEISVVPNPTKGSNIKVQLQLIQQSPVTLQVTDLSGRVLHKEKSLAASTGTSAYTINGINLRSGTYIILAEQNNRIVARTKFIVAE